MFALNGKWEPTRKEEGFQSEQNQTSDQGETKERYALRNRTYYGQTRVHGHPSCPTGGGS